MLVRLDTYLWAIRLFKTRTLSSEFIKSGKVKTEGKALKPSHSVKLGEIFNINLGSNEKKIVEVVKLIDKRLSFELAKACYLDLSPVKEKDMNVKNTVFKSNIEHEKGTGRPTKKNRRDLGKHGGWF